MYEDETSKREGRGNRLESGLKEFNWRKGKGVRKMCGETDDGKKGFSV